MSDETTLRTLSFEHLEQLAADGGLEGTSDADWSAGLADFALRHDGHLTAFSEAYGAERKAFLIGVLAGRLQAQQSAAERERWSEPTTAAAFAALRIMSREGAADAELRTAAVVTLCASVGGLGADGLPPSGWGDAPSEAIRLLVNLLVLDNKRTLSALKDLGAAIPALVTAIAAPDEMAMPLEQLRLYTQCAFHASLSPSDAALDVGAALAAAVAGLDWSVSRLSDSGGGGSGGGGGSLGGSSRQRPGAPRPRLFHTPTPYTFSPRTARDYSGTRRLQSTSRRWRRRRGQRRRHRRRRLPLTRAVFARRVAAEAAQGRRQRARAHARRQLQKCSCGGHA